MAMNTQLIQEKGGGCHRGGKMGRKELGKEKALGGEVPKTKSPLHVVFTPKEEWYWGTTWCQ